MRHLYLTLIIAIIGIAHVAEVHAQACQPIEISWPVGSDEPIWELTALPPSLSTGPSGSGLEIRDVKFHGHRVFSQAHIPMINVQYITGLCFRDWISGNTRFDAPNVTGTCFAEPESGATVTTCDLGVGVNDIGNFTGIAMEDHGHSFTLISHSQAGWYRYTIKWTFERDGTIRPEFGFSHTPSSTANNARWHNIYWRFDFDIDDGDTNQAYVSHHGEDWQLITQETTDVWVQPEEDDLSFTPSMWQVLSTTSDRGYTITPGQLEYGYPVNPGTGNSTVDNFAEEDIAFSVYRQNQYTDGGGACKVDFRRSGTNRIVRDESIDEADIVVWYRTGATRLGGNEPTTEDVCEPLGPVLRPVGTWISTPTETELDVAAQTLLQVYPNPFDQTTTIRYSVEQDQNIRIMLYDALGREVRNLYEGQASAGAVQELILDGSSLPNGVYTVQVIGESGPINATRIVLVR